MCLCVFVCELMWLCETLESYLIIFNAAFVYVKKPCTAVAFGNEHAKMWPINGEHSDRVLGPYERVAY